MAQKKHFFSILLDLLIASISVGVAISISLSISISQKLNNSFSLGLDLFSPLLDILFISVLMGLTYVVALMTFKLYDTIWSYAGTQEIMSLAYSCIVGSIGVGLLIWRMLSLPSNAFIIATISGVLCFILLVSTRYTISTRNEWWQQKKMHRPQTRLLIIGTGELGVGVLRQLRKESDNGYLTIGFIDDDAQKVGQRIHGLEILGTTEELTYVMRKFRIDEVVIAMSSDKQSRAREIIRFCQNKNCSFKVVPSIDAILADHISINQIREVLVEDLLNRPTVEIDLLSEVSQYLSGKRVMVTGAGGSIGSELCRQIAQFQPGQLLLFGRGENSLYHIQNELTSFYGNDSSINCETVIGDIRDHSKVFRIIEKYQPQIIFHAAAHKHVTFMELHPDEAVKNNILGTKNLVDAAIHHQVESFILVSSDKAVNPTSVMGASKRVTEKLIQAKAQGGYTKFVAVRFGNVFDSRGSALPRFRQQIAKGGPVTVTHREVTRYFMTIPESVQLLIQAGAMGNGGEVFILDMGEPIKILDLVCDLIHLSGLEVDRDIKIEFTGLAPGEKLYEELLTAEEGVTATKHQRIFVAQPETIDLHGLLAQVTELRQLAVHLDNEKIIQKLQEIVPTYQPNRGFIKTTTSHESSEVITADNDVIHFTHHTSESFDVTHTRSSTETNF